jgi:DNA-binding CsgD family transcriptional regulator
LATLDGALVSTCARGSRVVLLAGEPGIGKTRLAQEICERAARTGMLSLWGRCPEEPGAPPYWPWLQAIRRYVELQDDEAVHATIGPAADYLVGLDPALGSLFPDRTSVVQTIGEAAQARFMLFDAIASFWRRAAARQPLLLVLDDLHRADTPSLRLLEFVCTELGACRIMVLGTYRDMEITRQHPFSQTLAELSRHASMQRLRLTGFNEAETQQFIADRVARPDLELAYKLHQRTEGHPLFLVEMARYLEEGSPHDQRIPAGASQLATIPLGIREVIGGRLHRLSARCMRMLGAAAVFGRRFPLETLNSLYGELSPQGLMTAIEEARRAALIEPAEPGMFQFTHALLRETLYDELPAAERAVLHHRIAMALEAHHADDPTPVLAQLAHHFHAARATGTEANAHEYATRAAERASALLAHEEAARYYELALQTPVPGARGDARRSELLVQMGEAQDSAGDSTQALATLTRATQSARALGDAALLGRAAMAFEHASWRTGRSGEKAARLLSEALALFPAEDSDQRVRLQSALCRALLFSNRSEEATAVAAQAVAAARRLGNPATLVLALSAIVPGSGTSADQLRLKLAAGHEAIEIARSNGHAEWAVDLVTGFMVGHLMQLGQIREAAAMARLHTGVAERMRQPFLLAVGLVSLAMIAIHEGRFEDGERLALEAHAEGSRADRGNAAGAFSVQMFTIRRAQGRLQEVMPLLKQFRDNVADAATWRPGLALLYCELGMLTEAREVFESLAIGRFAAVRQDSLGVTSIAYLAEVCVRLGDETRAPVLIELLSPYADRNLLFGWQTASLGSAARLLGMLATTIERWEIAEGHFERALVMDAASGGLPWLAFSRYEYAVMLLARRGDGDSSRAEELLSAALETSRSLGMRGLEARCVDLQRRKLHVQHDDYPAGLTAREVQVLQLIAAGKSNQEIATALFRSANTVANHVRNILGKLNVANRTEAAAFAVRNGLVKQ